MKIQWCHQVTEPDYSYTDKIYKRNNETEDQRKTRYEVERNRNRQQMNVVFNHYRPAFNYYVKIDYSLQRIVAAIGPMNVLCRYCEAFKFKNEVPGLCCSSG